MSLPIFGDNFIQLFQLLILVNFLFFVVSKSIKSQHLSVVLYNYFMNR